MEFIFVIVNTLYVNKEYMYTCKRDSVLHICMDHAA